MSTLDASAFFALILATVLAALLVGVLPPWRRMMNGRNLPVWSFLRRRGLEAGLGEGASLQAELRCALCAGRPQCARQLAIGDGSEPPEHCPNARFLEKLGLPGRENRPTDARRGRD